MQFAPILTPHGRLLLAPVEDAPPLPPGLARRLEEAFARGSGHGLLQLGAGEVGTALPPVLGYWREFGARYVTALCTLPDVGDGASRRAVPPPPDDDLESLAVGRAADDRRGVPDAPTSSRRSGTSSTRRFEPSWPSPKASVQDFLAAQEPGLEPGRPRALQPRREPEGRGGAVRVPRDLHDAAVGAREGRSTCRSARRCASTRARPTRPRLLSLLLPVQRAAEQCAWLKAMVDAGEIYHPLRWTPAEAFQLLSDRPALEAAGVVVRVPGDVARRTGRRGRR